jgi:hypothetical protein
MTRHSNALETETFRQGLTLPERLRLKVVSPSPRNIDNRIGRERLEIWRSWFNRDSTGAPAWGKFLAHQGLTEAQLKRLDGLANLNGKLPDWVVTFQHIRNYLERVEIKPRADLDVADNLARAATGWAIEKISSSKNWRMLSANAQLSVEESLVRRLARTARPAVNWELLAMGADRQFSRGLKRDGVPLQIFFLAPGIARQARRLLENYPALARLWAVQIGFWLSFVEDFLEHAKAFRDRGRIGKAIVSEMDVDLSDPHEGNRAVIRVRFGQNDEWFYKPRGGQHEKAWFDLLGWFNDNGFPLPFRILETRCKDRHCWMESVHSRACRNENELADFCFRLGALMCLMHVLRGVDFHPANVIACGDQPIVVDCETLFHPATRLPEYASAEEESLFRTGALAIVRRISGLTPKARFSNERVLENLENGFGMMNDSIRTDRSAAIHLKKWAKSLGRNASRLIHRPTAQYGQMLERSLVPSLLTSGLERSLFLHACCGDAIQTSRRASAEVKALENSDIPLFRGKPRVASFDLSRKTVDQSIVMMRQAFAAHHKGQVQR